MSQDEDDERDTKPIFTEAFTLDLTKLDEAVKARTAALQKALAPFHPIVTTHIENDYVTHNVELPRYERNNYVDLMLIQQGLKRESLPFIDLTQLANGNTLSLTTSFHGLLEGQSRGYL
ncbi:MAG: hypothetical protein J0L97_07815 [Alphaproteobacteria bacterium]|nr:hypothetical protein [Alphaproteobacteria bacterium]